MLCTKVRFLSPRSRSPSGQRSKSCLSNNSKTTEANLTKFHRKIEHNGKVCSAQELGSYAQGQGHNQVRGQIVPKIVLLINYRSKFDRLHRKIKDNEKVRHTQHLGSYTQGQGRDQVRGQNRVSAITRKLLKQI